MGNRNGGQCVGSQTNILVKAKGKPNHFEKRIGEIQCLFNVVREPDGVRFMKNPNYSVSEHMIVTLDPIKKAVPLFRYEYEFDPKFPQPLYEITIDGPPEHPGPFVLTATEWHPVLRSPDLVTVASILEEHDQVHLRHGEGHVKSVRKVKQTSVVGLALGDLGEPPFREGDLEKLRGTLESGAGLWADFGLTNKETIIFTEGVATGSLSFQYRMREKLSQGMSIDLSR
jgi:hypothetical protein